MPYQQHPAPPKGAHQPVFWVGCPRSSRAWTAALIARSGDVHPNPGPPKTSKQTPTNKPTPTTWTCTICTKQITKNQTSLRCNTTVPHWIHLKCSQTTVKAYRTNNSWTCPNHTNPSTNTTSTNTNQTTPNLPAPANPPSNKTPQLPNPLTTTTPQLPNPLKTTTPKPPHPPANLTSQQPNPNSPPPHASAAAAHTNPKQITLIQININGINTKKSELADYLQKHQPDVVTIQETKLTPKAKTPTFSNYTTIRTDRTFGKPGGGGLITLVKSNITFTETNHDPTLTGNLIEMQITKLHLNQQNNLHIANLYIPPRETTNPNQQNEKQTITDCLTHLFTLENSIISGDVNAHSPLWFSPTTDQRGDTIDELITNSNHLVLNQNLPTRLPHCNQQATSPDITTISSNLYPRATWTTDIALSSDHLPIHIKIHTKAKFHITQNKHSYTNYKKADWTSYTNEIENILHDASPPSHPHTANKILTNAILSADKHHIPKGKINSKHSPLPNHIRTLIDT